MEITHRSWRKECTQAQIEKAIPLAIQALIKEDEIAPSWAKMKMEKLVKKQFKKNSEWVATFVDPSPKTPAEQRLYVFITLDGYLNGSNYTGE